MLFESVNSVRQNPWNLGTVSLEKNLKRQLKDD